MLQNLLQKNNNKEYLIIRGITSKSFDNNRAKILNEEVMTGLCAENNNYKRYIL
jgi:hypothetical protein